MLPPSNPDQAMVDNATSAMASRMPTMVGRGQDPRTKGNGRNEAISRRLSRIKKNQNG